jgi:hypothetical protein
VRLSIASLFIAAAALASGAASAGTIYDSLSAGNQYLNTKTGGSGLAQSFTTTATDSTITGAILKLSNNYPQPPGNYSVSIWGFDTVSHLPTTQVASIYSGDMSNLSNSLTEVSYSGLTIALAPLTSYYMVVLSDPAGGGIGWATSAFSAGDLGNSSQFYTSYNFATSTWATAGSSSTSPRIMQITAEAAAVPEIDPASASSVMALVASALGLLERRTRRKLG